MAGTLVLCLANGALHHHIGLYLFVLFGAPAAPSMSALCPLYVRSVSALCPLCVRSVSGKVTQILQVSPRQRRGGSAHHNSSGVGSEAGREAGREASEHAPREWCRGAWPDPSPD